jgi:hypothetical protein
MQIAKSNLMHFFILQPLKQVWCEIGLLRDPDLSVKGINADCQEQSNAFFYSSTTQTSLVRKRITA